MRRAKRSAFEIVLLMGVRSTAAGHVKDKFSEKCVTKRRGCGIVKG